MLAIALVVWHFAASCASTDLPRLENPDDTVDALRSAFNKDEVELFLHCLSQPVKKKFSPHTIRIAWGEIRPLIGELAKDAEVEVDGEYKYIEPDPNAPDGYVWPNPESQLLRVTLRIEGRSEHFLLVRETDDPPENSKQAVGFWINDTYHTRNAHGSPDTYLTNDSPPEERTHWRLVLPYYPFQNRGELTRELLNAMNESSQ